MPSAFIPLNLVYEEADEKVDDMQIFEKELFVRLASGSIGAHCEDARRSSLIVSQHDELGDAFAQLELSLRLRSGIEYALKASGIAHVFTANGYVTVNKINNGFELMIDGGAEPIPGSEILPSFWEWEPYYDKGRDTVVSLDYLNITRSTFFRVAIDRKDILNSGLIGTSEVTAYRRGRKDIYDNAQCNAMFVTWHRINPKATRERNIAKLREIYKEHELTIGTDEKGRAEIQTIKSLLALGAERPK